MPDSDAKLLFIRVASFVIRKSIIKTVNRYDIIMRSMEAAMKKFITFSLYVTVYASISFSQDHFNINPEQMLFKPTTKHQGSTIELSTFHSPKKPGHYTKEEWGALIDSLWGPGLPTLTKLEIFDTFWDGIDRGYAAFPNLDVNWDSLRTRYRPEVEAGVSRGRFSGIMSQLFLAVQDAHAGIEDVGIDSVNGISVHDTYLPGVPLFWPTGWDKAGNFGAALTPMPDSSLLVYRAITPHPLGLVPGDIILGYDGIPWKRLVREILEAELPTHDQERGSTPRSWTHGLLNSAGKNWGLFDTIDIVKYATGDTLHLPTTPLAGQTWNLLYGTEQVAVPGVSMPDRKNGENCTWGVVENTSVGYIYIYNWLEGTTGVLFAAALKDLLTVKNVTGLIIDSRFNIGGYLPLYNSTLDPLFNFNPAGPSRWRTAARLDPTDHFSHTYYAMFDSSFQMKPDYYDRPIAFLSGPAACSGAELIAFQMRFHPMVRMFGLPTSGAFPALGTIVWEEDQWGSWAYIWYQSQPQSLVNNEGFLVHKGFPVDEEIWLTRDDVVKGEDTVVKRAIEWINNLSHAHNVSVDRTFIRSNVDTVTISAVVENPNQHPLTVLATVTDDNNAVLDSMYLYDDGLHHDGQAGDKIWAHTFVYNSNTEQIIHVTTSTKDPIAGDTRRLPNATQFTSIGPLVLDGITNASTDKEVNAGDNLKFKFKIRNEGTTATAMNISSYVVPLDTCVSITVLQKILYSNIAAGASVEGSLAQYIRFNKYCAGQTARFVLNIYTDTYQFWSDTFSIPILTGMEQREEIAVKDFDLIQNYPNPFNPITTIEFALPKSEWVTLNVFNIIGQQVTTLVSEKLNPGVHKYEWQADNLPSGIYYCRMQAGEFKQVRKMILIK